MNKGRWSLFNIATVCGLTLLASGLPASALGNNRPEQTKEASSSQLAGCTESKVKALISRWREPYLPAGSALRDCGDSAIAPLIEVMADSTLKMRTRQLTARLIRQMGSEASVQSLIAALGNYRTQEVAWASLLTMHEESKSELIDAVSSILLDTEMPLECREGAIRFVELYAIWSSQPVYTNTSGEMLDELLAIVANEAEEDSLRIRAAEVVATIVYEVGGNYAIEGVQPEMLARVAASESNLAVSQSAMNALVMTYYMTVTHGSCFYRMEEREELERILLSVENRNTTNDVQELSAVSDEAEQERTRAAFRNVMNITYPEGIDTCPSFGDITPGVQFIDRVESRNQPRLIQHVIQWANTKKL